MKMVTKSELCSNNKESYALGMELEKAGFFSPSKGQNWLFIKPIKCSSLGAKTNNPNKFIIFIITAAIFAW